MIPRPALICAALLLSSCGNDMPNDANAPQERSDPRSMLPRKDLAEQTKIDYTTAMRCLWLSQFYMADSDPETARATMRVQTQARFFANQRATEAGKSPAQVEQDLLDITSREAVSSAPPPSECSFLVSLSSVGSPPSQEDQARCDAAYKRQSDQRAEEIASGVRPDRAKMQRNEYTTICIPLLGS